MPELNSGTVSLNVVPEVNSGTVSLFAVPEINPGIVSLMNKYATRNQLKQVLLAKAAADRDKTCVNSAEAYCKENSKGLRAKSRIKKGDDHGKGNDHSLFAASSRSEREAMGRLLAM